MLLTVRGAATTEDGFENVGGEASATSLSQTEPPSPQGVAGTALCAAQLRGEGAAPSFAPLRKAEVHLPGQ